MKKDLGALIYVDNDLWDKLGKDVMDFALKIRKLENKIEVLEKYIKILQEDILENKQKKDLIVLNTDMVKEVNNDNESIE